jgi:hypothetical protein
MTTPVVARPAVPALAFALLLLDAGARSAVGTCLAIAWHILIANR